MKLIYRGGFNKHSEKSIRNSVISTYDKFMGRFIKAGKQVAYVTLAKKDGDYESRFPELKVRPVINWSNYQQTDWPTFDFLILLGGYSLSLYRGLKESGFSLDVLQKDVVVVGDSAGAYVLSSYFVERHDLGKKVNFLPGFNPGAKLITLGHVDNPAYVDQGLTVQVEAFAKKKSLSVLRLKENEEKMLVGGKIVKFDRDEEFSLNSA